ncbi:MAG: sodium:proton exchanger, partial [Burkholderiales bacterium]
MAMHETYHVMTALLLVAALVGALALQLRQPLIVAFIVTGILVGPAMLDWVGPNDQIAALAEIGVTVLLFAVGLKLDMQHVRMLGPVALATGAGQLAFTILFGYLIGIGLGMGTLEAVYVAVALTFSSTIIIVKLLSDKREIDSLHGRIAVGFLIVQDIAVVIAMMVVGSLGGAGGDGWVQVTALIAGKLVAALLVVFALMRYVLPWLMRVVSRSQELLLIFAIAWGTALATLGEAAGFSKEVGAFLAGFSLASSEYRESISARLSGIRDFLLLFFFVELGAKLELGALGAQLFESAVFSAFVLIGNPLIVMAIMGYMGYRRRTGFLAGLTVAQISEFSIVFVAMGMTMGHVGNPVLGLITLVGLVTIAASTYMILYSHQLYTAIEPWLSIFERSVPFRERQYEEAATKHEAPAVIVYGLGRYGSRLVSRLEGHGVRVLGVDFDPEVVRGMHSSGRDTAFGDAEDPEFPLVLPLRTCRWVVSTLDQADVNAILLRSLRRAGFAGEFAAVTHRPQEADVLRRGGVTLLLTPFADAADFA